MPVEIPIGATETVAVINAAAGVRVTGATVRFYVRRQSDGLYLDWADNTFKSYTLASAGTLYQSLTESGSDAGFYSYSWNTSTIANAATVAREVYEYVVSQSAPTAIEMYADDIVAVNLATMSASLRGTASAGATSSITLAGGVATDNLYRYSEVTILAGTGAGQTRSIVYYIGSSKVAYVGRPWDTSPDSTSVYAVLPNARPEIVDSGLAQAGGATSITLSAASSAVTDFYVGCTVDLAAGTGAGGQPRVITAYNGSTKVATVVSAWATNPDSTSVYVLYPMGRSIVVSNLDKTGYALTGGEETAIAAAVLGTVVPGAFGATTAGGILGNNLNAKISILSGTTSSATTNGITLTGGSSVDNYYRYALVRIDSGAGAGQVRQVLNYVGSTKVASVSPTWSTTPDATSAFVVLPAAGPVLIDSGFAQTGAAFTITLSATSSASDNLYVGSTVMILSGTGAGQERVITSYVGSTKVATLDGAWVSQPDFSSLYVIVPSGRSLVVSNLDKTGYGLAAASVDSTSLAGSAISAIQSGLATTSGLTTLATTVDNHTDTQISALQSHGDTAWATATSVAVGVGGITSSSFASGAINAAAIASAAITAAKFSAGAVDANALAQAAADKIWATASRTLTAIGSSGIADAAAVAQVIAILAAAQPVVAAGSSSTVIKTNATQATGFFDGAVLVIVNAAGVSARRVLSYSSINGAFTLAAALPFTPSASDQSFVLTTQAAAAPGDAMALTSGERTTVQALVLSDATPFPGARIDAAITSRAFPGDLMGLAAGAITSGKFASGAITSTAFATGAIDAGAFNQTAADKVWTTTTRYLTGIGSSGIAAQNSVDALPAAIWSTPTPGAFSPGTAGARLDVDVSSGGSGNFGNIASAVWDELYAGHNTAGSFAVLTKTSLPNLDTTITSRATAAAAAIALLDQALLGHTTAGTAGASLGRVDIAVSSRAAPDDAMSLSDGSLTAAAIGAGYVGALQTNLVTTAGLTTALAGLALEATLDGVASNVLSAMGSGFGAGDDLHSVRAAITGVPVSVWSTVVPGAFASNTAGGIIGNRLDVTVGSRSTLTQNQILNDAVPFSGAAIAHLDADVGSRSTLTALQVVNQSIVGAPSGSVGAALASASGYTILTGSQVANAVWTAAETGATGTFGYALTFMRMLASNRLEEAPGNPGAVVLYADDGTTIWKTWTLRDAFNNAVSATAGDPAKRSAAS